MLPLTHVDLSEVVPDAYSAWRPVLRDALWEFLARLPEHRRHHLAARQAALPPDTGVAERLVALMHDCPTLHKLGQMLSRDRRLPPSLRQHLQTMESLEPRTPAASVRAWVHRELGRDTEVVLDAAPLAEGSVAVVVPFATRDGRARGVLKVLRDGIEERLAEELDIWPQVADLAADRCAAQGLPAVQVRDTLQAIAELLAWEVHLDRERANLLEAVPSPLVVPAPLAWRTPRLLSMERLHGRKVTDAHAHDRRRLARALAESLIAQPWTSPSPHALFHADPHAGNLMVLRDGRPAAVDWSLTGRLSRHERMHLTQVLLGGALHERERVLAGLQAVTIRTCARDRLDGIVDEALRRLRRDMPLGTSWLTTLLDDVVLAGAARLGANLLLFRKSLLSLEGVLADLSDTASLDAVMLDAVTTRLALEWPARLVTDVAARPCGSHLSTLDLIGAWWGAPAAALRALTACWDDR